MCLLFSLARSPEWLLIKRINSLTRYNDFFFDEQKFTFLLAINIKVLEFFSFLLQTIYLSEMRKIKIILVLQK